MTAIALRAIHWLPDEDTMHALALAMTVIAFSLCVLALGDLYRGGCFSSWDSAKRMSCLAHDPRPEWALAMPPAWARELGPPASLLRPAP